MPSSPHKQPVLTIAATLAQQQGVGISDISSSASINKGIKAVNMRWTIKEQLLLTSAVQQYGEHDWDQVSSTIIKFIQDNTTNYGTLASKISLDFYSPARCQAQFHELVEYFGTPNKRKRTTSDDHFANTPGNSMGIGSNSSSSIGSSSSNSSSVGGSGSTALVGHDDISPIVLISRRLVADRLDELRKAISHDSTYFKRVCIDIVRLENMEMDNQLDHIIQEVQIKIAQRESERSGDYYVLPGQRLESDEKSVPLDDNKLSSSILSASTASKMGREQKYLRNEQEERGEGKDASRAGGKTKKPSKEKETLGKDLQQEDKENQSEKEEGNEKEMDEGREAFVEEEQVRSNNALRTSVRNKNAAKRSVDDDSEIERIHEHTGNLTMEYNSVESRAQTPSPPPPVSQQWKKSILIIWRNIATHKFANIFSKPVSIEDAPDYYNIIKRPMDLSTIKKRIEEGQIRNSKDFLRDMYLMFENAFMFNNESHDIYQMALEMRSDVRDQMIEFMNSEES